MKHLRSLVFLSALAATSVQADFFKNLTRAVEDTVKKTAEHIVVTETEKIIRDMIVGYTTKQTRTEEEVSDEYVREHGKLPRTTVSSYKSEIFPGTSVSPGTRVRVNSLIEVVPGRDGGETVIEEQLTIYDNEDHSAALKSMTKRASKESERGGEFRGEFSFTLPEGLPQGVYPVRSNLLLNGELVADQSHELQLVIFSPEPGIQALVASLAQP